MILRHAIIHEIIKDKVVKDQEQKSPEIIEGELLDVSSDAVVQFIDSIRKIYGSKNNSSSGGTFDNAGEGKNLFSDDLDLYLDVSEENGESECDVFKEFSLKTMRRLKDKIENSNFATGGYIVFGHYVPENKDFESTGMLLVAMVKNKNGMKLENLIPEETQTVDLSKLHQAVRVDIEKYVNWIASSNPEEEQFQAYLTFISPKSSESTTGYFIKAIGCSNAYSNRVATNKTIQAVKDFFSVDERMSHLSRTAKEFVAEKLNSLSLNETESDRVCSLNLLDAWVDSILPDDCLEDFGGKFSEFANNPPYNVPASFVSNGSAARASMKLKIDAKDEGWKMDFERSLLGYDETSIIYFNKNNSEIIIRSIPENIKNILIDELGVDEGDFQ